MSKGKTKVTKERQVNTYAEMRHASRVILEKAEKDSEGSFYQFMASLVFTAFTMEAYLNHIGQHIFKKSWKYLERPLSPSAKLNLITEKLEIEKDDGKRPYRTLSDLFKFRNSIAHGKSITLKSEETRIVDDTCDNDRYKFLQTEWEKYCTSENAKRALEDVEKIIEELHNAAGITNDCPFILGMQSRLTTVFPEQEQNSKRINAEG